MPAKEIDPKLEEAGGGSQKQDGELARTVGLKSIIGICLAAMTGTCLTLPAGAFALTGTSMSLGIILSAVVVCPHVFSKSELATAMPRNGGDFVYLSQAYGPWVGTMCGTGLMSCLLLKASFGLSGFKYYLEAATGKMDKWKIDVITMGILVLITGLNLMGLKKLKAWQKKITLFGTVFLFILSLVAFKDFNSDAVSKDYFVTNGGAGIIESAAFVYMSYAGLTKVTAMAGECKNPTKNMPKGMFISLFVMLFFFSVSAFAISGTVPLDHLDHDYAPFYTMTEKIVKGKWFAYCVCALCIVTMVGLANVALAAVSRFPFSMAEDGLLPEMFAWRIQSNDAPWVSILFCSFIMGVCVLTLDVKSIAKLASSFNLLMFICTDISVLIYRGTMEDTVSDEENKDSEGRRNSLVGRTSGKEISQGKYDPGFMTPYFPYVQYVGMSGQLVLLCFLGYEGLIAVAVFAFLGSVVYALYGIRYANFLGIIQPEYYLGVLPVRFQNRQKYENELKRIKENPMHHLDEFLEKSYKAKFVNQDHWKKHEFNHNYSRDQSKLTGTTLSDLTENSYVWRICITGGHHGGNHLARQRFAKALTEEVGFDVYAPPTMVQLFVNGGASVPCEFDSKDHRMIWEENVLKMQIEAERSFLKIAESSGRPSCLIVDRGSLDPKAYIDHETWKTVIKHTEFDEKYLLDRYDLVLHFVTAADGDADHWVSDGQTKAQALEDDKRLQDCYKNHHHHVILGNQNGLAEKFKEGFDEILGLIHQTCSGTEAYFHESDLEDLGEAYDTHPEFMNASGRRRMSLTHDGFAGLSVLAAAQMKEEKL